MAVSELDALFENLTVSLKKDDTKQSPQPLISNKTFAVPTNIESDEYCTPITELYGLRLRKPFYPKPYQITAIKWGLQRENEEHKGIRGGLYVVEMGLGKTLISLGLIFADLLRAQEMKLLHQVGPTLCIVPKSLLTNWNEEALKFIGKGARVLLYFKDLMSDKTLFDRITYNQMQEYNLVLTTFETVALQSKTLKPGMVGPSLLFQPWYRIIVDESHVFANPKNKLFLSLMRLQSKRKIALTGTPIRNYDVDMFAQMRFLNFDSVTNCKRWNDKVFHQHQLSKVIFSLTTDEAQITLPTLNEITVDCPLSENEMKLYQQYESKNKSLFEKFLDNKESKSSKRETFGQLLTALIRLRQLCISPTLLPADEIREFKFSSVSSKFQQFQDIIEHKIPKQKKVIVFSNWTKVLKIAQSLLPSEACLLVDGKMSTKTRAVAFDIFKNNPTVLYLLITYKVGNVGLNLTHSQYVIMLEPWWSAVLKLQAQKRVHRIGQNEPVYIYNLLVPNSIETKIVEKCHTKTKLALRYLDKHQAEQAADGHEPAPPEQDEKPESRVLHILSSLFTLQ